MVSKEALKFDQFVDRSERCLFNSSLNPPPLEERIHEYVQLERMWLTVR